MQCVQDLDEIGLVGHHGVDVGVDRERAEIAQVELVGSEFNPRAVAEADAAKADAAKK